MNKLKMTAACCLVFLAGLALGAYLFVDIQARPVLTWTQCRGNGCISPQEFSGLLAAAGIRRAPRVLPGIVRESDRCLAIRNPFPEAHHHFVMLPKRDILDIGSLGPGDAPYMMDCIGLMQSLIRDLKLRRYRVLTNGPGFQKVRYLHFHLMADASDARLPDIEVPAY